MKAKLIKRDNDYCLYNESEDIIAASWANVTGKKLSKQNCDEIFGVIDVEKLAEKEYPTFNLELNLTTSFNTLAQAPFIKGFNKAIELYQPTEIEVAIEMERIPDGLDESCHIQYSKVPKLDENGYLILKKL
jgi:hypothetical protein